ncbi:hypothetical protein P8452_59287 [Trifolium repens]|jgi:hypothetical protein|nr:hypothetical protein P8452_59287 [Trifolium repens]
MARNLFVLALIFVAVVGVTMAAEAPSSSPKTSPTTASSPKKSTPETASPKSSPAPPTSSDHSPAASPSNDEDSIDLAAPAPGPSSEFAEEEPSIVDDESTSGASSLKVSAAVAAVAAGFFAF